MSGIVVLSHVFGLVVRMRVMGRFVEAVTSGMSAIFLITASLLKRKEDERGTEREEQDWRKKIWMNEMHAIHK